MASPSFVCPSKSSANRSTPCAQMGVEFETDVVVGRTVTIDELLEEEGYDAVYIGLARAYRSS